MMWHKNATFEEKLNVLKMMGQRVKWSGNQRTRCDIFDRILYPVIKNWRFNKHPDILKIFDKKKMNVLLLDVVSRDDFKFDRTKCLIDFVINCGYKDEPEKHQTTALHILAKRRPNNWVTLVKDFFVIYNNYDKNCIDKESDLSHFQIAVMSGCKEIAQKFLGLEDNLDCLIEKTQDSLLHIALRGNREHVVESLVIGGANLNLVNANGETPLHIICLNENTTNYNGLAQRFFDICDEKRRTVHIDAKDKLGRTPLQIAVENSRLDVIYLLLARGANLSSIVFPKKIQLAKSLETLIGTGDNLKSLQASVLFALLDSLKRGGYELDGNDTLAIKKCFNEYESYQRPANLENNQWSNSEEYTSKAKTIQIITGLSLYDLTLLKLDEVAQLLGYSNYFELVNSSKFPELPQGPREKMSRKLYRQWAQEFFYELIDYRLPILCCDMVVKHLNIQDFSNVCSSAEVPIQNVNNQDFSNVCCAAAPPIQNVIGKKNLKRKSSESLKEHFGVRRSVRAKKVPRKLQEYEC